MEGGEGEDTAVQTDITRRPQSALPGPAGDCHSNCAAMAVHGHGRERGAEVRTASLAEQLRAQLSRAISKCVGEQVLTKSAQILLLRPF